MRGDSLKAEIVPHIPDILTDGEVTGAESCKNSKDRRRNVLSYTKTAETSQGKRLVIVDVLDRESVAPNPVAYNLTREGRKNYEGRQEHIKEKPQANDSQTAWRCPG